MQRAEGAAVKIVVQTGRSPTGHFTERAHDVEVEVCLAEYREQF